MTHIQLSPFLMEGWGRECFGHLKQAFILCIPGMLFLVVGTDRTIHPSMERLQEESSRDLENACCLSYLTKEIKTK